MSTQAVAPTRVAAPPAVTAAPAVLLQRTCDCGQHTAGGGECDDCKKKKLTLHRRSTGSFAPRTAPPIVHQVLGSSGQPLDKGTRAFMEPRFGHDFSHVRVHTDARASESARAVNASAYTVDDHIAFQAGNYDPASAKGRRLLAHELTHVVQNRNNPLRSQGSVREISDPADASEREASTVAERVLSGDAAEVVQGPDALVHRDSDTAKDVGIGLGIAAGVGAVVGAVFTGLYFLGVFITEHGLQKYLKKLDDTNKIEGGVNSDIKARRIAESWGKGETKFVLTIRRRALLILEMLDGHVSHWDKDGIMNILERSGDVDLDYIFSAGGVSHAKLIAKLDSWKDEVRRFYKRRYSIDDIYQQKDFSALKAKSLGPIQPGDEIPQEDTDIFSPLADTKRRTKAKPIQAAESDKWVSDAYGAYLPKNKAGGQFIQQNVEINVAQDTPDESAETQFAYALQPHCQKERDFRKAQKKKEKGGQTLTKEETEQIDDQYQFCLNNPDVAGFFETAEEAEQKKAQIHIQGKKESATTRLHESLHAYADPDVARKLPHFASEGMTEYFTRQIALRQNLAISTSYDGPFLAIQEFAAKFGEKVLAQVYFQGQLDLICKNLVNQFGTGAYKDWAKAMQDQDTWADAVKVMQRPKPAQPPDLSECSPAP